VPAGCVFLFDEKRQELYPAATFGLPPEFREHMRPIPRALYEKYVSQIGSLVVIPDVQSLTDTVNADLYAALDIRTGISTRLQHEKNLVGAINAFTISQVRQFTEDELALLQGLAEQAALAINNARLYDAELYARRVAEIVCSANLALNQTLILDTALNTLLDYLRQLVPYDSASIMLLETESRLAVRAMRGYEHWTDSDVIRNITFDVRTNPIYNAMLTTRQSVLIPDTQQNPEWEWRDGGKHVRNWLGVPLIASGNVIGIYSMDKTQPGFFTEEHQRLAETLTAQAAVAIQNAWLFDQVRAGRERLQALSRRLVEVQESERRYISRELHDEAGQALASLIIGFRLLESEIDNPQTAVARIAGLRNVTNDVLENVRRLAVNLRPVVLDQSGLVAALRQYIAILDEQQGLVIEFEAIGSEDLSLSSEIETALFRIVQEALTNAIRHAHAKQIAVLLQRRGDQLVVTVEDDGIGFDPESALRTGHVGIVGMRERAEMLSGALSVESALGKGTTITLEVPYVNPDTHRG